MGKKGTAGNHGANIRSDCLITLELRDKGGIEIDLKSKVKRFFGASIEQICRQGLDFFGVEHASLTIQDSGALPFVLMARLEAAVKQCVETDKEFLPEMVPQNKYQTTVERYRRSRLYLPGNTPKLFINAGLHGADGIILDLEDSVAPAKKDEARYLVRNALRQNDFYGTERMVRINQLPRGLQDLDVVIPHHVNLVLIPKCESPKQVRQVESRIKSLCQQHKISDKVYLMPIIESAAGVMKAVDIAGASPKLVALAIGLEDYTADIGTRRTAQGRESFFARSMIVNAARAHRLQPIDSVYSDVNDPEGLKEFAQDAKLLGFDGIGCIHPRQVQVIHGVFTPTEAEIERATKIVNAFFKAEEKGLGVVALGSKMIDPPVVKRAQKIVDLAIESGKLDKNWRATYGS